MVERTRLEIDHAQSHRLDNSTCPEVSHLAMASVPE